MQTPSQQAHARRIPDTDLAYKCVDSCGTPVIWTGHAPPQLGLLFHPLKRHVDARLRTSFRRCMTVHMAEHFRPRGCDSTGIAMSCIVSSRETIFIAAR